VADILVSGERFSQGLSPGLSGSGVRPFSRARFCQGQSWTEVLSLLSVMLEDCRRMDIGILLRVDEFKFGELNVEM